VAKNAVFSGVSYVTNGFLHSIVSAMEAGKSTNSRFFRCFFIGCVNKNGKSRAKYCFGKTPMQTFRDSLPLAREKMLNQTVQTTAEAV